MAFREFEILEHAPPFTEFEFRLAPARSTLRLHIVAERSGEILEESVLAHGWVRVFGGGLEFTPQETEPGLYTFSGLPPGDYVASFGLHQTNPAPIGFAYQAVTVPENGGTIDVLVRVPPGGRLLLQVSGEDNRRFASPYPTLHLRRTDGMPAVPPRLLSGPSYETAVFVSQCNTGGQAYLYALPVGEYHCAITKKGFEPAETVFVISAGKTAMIELVLKKRR
jgi:hypothetical protein